MTKLKNSNWDKTKKNQIVTVVIVTVVTVAVVTLVIVTSLSKNTLTTNAMFSGQLFAILAMFCSNKTVKTKYVKTLVDASLIVGI